MADDPNPTPEPEGGDKPATGDKPGDLGDAGKKALDAERQARRDAEKQLKEMQARLKEIEDRDKSETERLTEQVQTLTRERDQAAARADRLEVAVTKALDEDNARRITSAAKRLTGSTREELEADADEFLTAFSPAAGGKPPNPKPEPDLKGGTDPEKEPEIDPDKIADKILARRSI